MLSIVQALLGPSGDTKQPYLLGALFGLTFPLGWFILFGLWLTALLSHGALRIAGRTSKLAYGGAGAVVGLLAGSLVVGYLFKEPIRAAFCGIPVGIACGLLFRRIALPAQSVPRSPRAPGSAMLHL